MDQKQLALFGASSFVGNKIFESLQRYVALATYNSHSFLGGVFFDATKMDALSLLKSHKITDAVIAFAEPDVDQCKRNELRSRQINVTGVKNVIDACIILGINPIFLSSEYVFDGKKGFYSETDLPSPNTLYGSQKLEIEDYLKKNCPESHAILRLAKVYGTQSADKSILSTWAKHIVKGQKIQCATDQFFTPVNVEFISEVIDKTINMKLRGTYHVAGMKHVNRYEMIKMLSKYLQFSINVEEIKLSELSFEDNRPLNLTMVADKIISATGLQHRDLEDDLLEFAKNSFA